ncbi:Lamina-associated polypeptide 2, isoform beta [Labeo rohita]|uniref:Lamina-associated polypeptide 2, isoform beta n=1 Tax=Labeo rohita TaxID=84645 RepID=A0ABQ8MG12_LABRO|nr:Lamina-associated polypeptide 2, isoform beta [Labeo rohita]
MTMLSSKSNEEIRWMLDDYGIKHGPVVEDVTYIQHRRPQRYDDVSNRTQAAYCNTSQARNMPENNSTPENGSTRLVPIWLQILVFLIVSGFLYLFFINMEPAEPVKRLT